MNMSAVLTQMGILVVIMAIGYICAKTGVAGQGFVTSASKIVMNVLLVATIFNSVIGTESDMDMGEIGFILLCFTIMLLAAALVGYVAAKIMRLKQPQYGVALFCVEFPNTVFMAFPIVEAVFGSEGLFIAALSNIPFNIILYTVGLSQLRGGFKGIGIKRMLCPPLIASVLAVVLFVSGLELPALVTRSISTISGATVPVSMLVVGVSLGSVPAKSAFTNWRAYAVSLVRLIIAPIVVYVILSLFVEDATILGTALILGSAPPAMVATLLAIENESDGIFASECVFIGTVLSALTMPTIIMLLL